MRSRLTTFLRNTFKLLSISCLIGIAVHLVFLAMCSLNLKIPKMAQTQVTNPIEVLWTDSDSQYGKISTDGTVIPFRNNPFNYTLHNIKDSTDIMHGTFLTGSLTVDVSNNRVILSLTFIERIMFLTLFFFGFFQFDKLFSSFRSDDPFNPKNSKRLKIIAYLTMGASPMIFLFDGLNILAFKNYKIDLNGGLMYGTSLNLQYIFLGLIILIVALAFEVGSQLKKESEYTI